MRNCAKCPVQADIQAGRYENTPWPRVPCSKCKWTEDTFFSIPYDEAEHEQLPLLVVHDPTDDAEEDLAGHLPVDVMNELVNRLLSLPPEQRDVVSYRFQGKAYKEIGQLMGASTQCTEMRHKIAMRDFPELKALFPEKTAKRNRRKAKR